VDEVSAAVSLADQDFACSAAAAKVETAKRSLDLQLRTIRDDDAKDGWAAHISAADERFAAAKRSHSLKKEQAELFGRTAAAHGSSAGAAAAGYRGPTNDEYLDRTDAVHDDIDASLQATLQVVNDTEDLAAATAEQLAKQRDQIVDVHQSVLSIEDALKRSDALLRTFGKRMATDKMIQLFFMLNAVGVVGLIVYMVLQDQGVGASDDGGQAADDATPGADDATATDVSAAVRHFMRR
jgi:SNARE protein